MSTKRIRHTVNRVFRWILLPLGFVGIVFGIIIVHEGGLDLDFFSAERGDDPALYWTLNDSGSTINDSSGNSKTATSTNTQSRSAKECSTDLCRFFNGTSAHISRAYSSDTSINPGTAAFTLSLWFRAPVQSSGTRILVSRFNGAGYKLYLNSSNNLCFGIDDDSTWGPDDGACTTDTFNNSKWHFVQAVRGSGYIRLYVNGTQLAEDTSLSASGSLNGSSPTLYLGVDSNGSSNRFQGHIDDFKIFMYERNQNQRSTDMNSIGGPSSAGVAVGESIRAYTDALVGHWKLDESAANTCTGGVNDSCDNSGNVNDGDWNGSVARVRTGRFSNAATFDGTGDFIQVANNASLNPTAEITFGGWFRPNSTLASRALMVKDAQYRLVTDASGFPICQIHDGTNWLTAVTSSAALTLSNWHHVACSFDGKQLSVVLNGVQTGTVALVSAIGTSTNTLVFGRDNGGTYSDFNGVIDEVRIYNAAMTSDSIRQRLYLYAPDPIFHYRLDDGSGTTAIDSSSNGFDATLTNGPNWTQGKYGGALDFDGSNDHVVNSSVSIPEPDTPITLMAWVRYPTTSSSTLPFLSVDSGTNSQIALGFRSNNIVAQRHGGVTLVSTAQPVANTWHHVAYTSDGTTNRLYLNGNLVSSATPTMNTLPATRIIIGSTLFGSEYWLGQIDDVKMYSYNRTHEQIIEDMNGNKPAPGGNTSSPAVWLKFDDGSGTTALNSGIIGTAGNGTLANFASPPTATSGWATNAMLNKSLRYDGSNDGVNSGSDSTLDDLQEFTYCAWVHPTSMGGASEARLFHKGGTSNRKFLGFNVGSTNGLRLLVDRTSTDGEAISVDNALSMNTWSHLCGSFSITEGPRIYVNGKEVSYTSRVTGVGTLVSEASENIYIGNTGNNDRAWNGWIDEAKVYLGVLTLEQIQSDANLGSSVQVGSKSTDTTGLVYGRSDDVAYCVPGDTATCRPPINEWLLDENTGTSVANTSIRTSTTTFYNSPVWIPGKNGAALSFNGSTQHVLLTDIQSMNATTGTLSLWARTAGRNSGDQMIFMGSQDASRFYIYRMNSTGNFGFRIGSTSTVNTGVAIPADTWTHLAVTYDSGTYYAYMNGRQVATGAYSGFTSPRTHMSIGAYSQNPPGSVNTYYNGLVDQVRVFDFTMTPSQIAWDYNRGGPVAWYKLDECTGTTANDSSGNGLVGTITISGSGSQTAAGTCDSGNSAHAWYNGRNGVFNSSLAFDGDNEYATISDNNVLDIPGSFSITSWVYADSFATSYQNILKKFAVDGVSLNYDLSFDIDSPLCGFTSSGYSGAVGLVPLQTGVWYHVACVFNAEADTATIYVNGQKITQGWRNNGSIVSEGGVTSTPPTGAGAMTIGGDNVGWSGDLDGRIDDLRLYNYPLTLPQIYLIMNEGAAVRYGKPKP